jgi:hypothetical protein
MAPHAKKARTPKTPKAPRPPKPEAAGESESTGQSVKLANAIKKLEFLDRLLGRSIAAFGGAPGADAIHGALAEAQQKVTAAMTDARTLPVGFRFGSGGSGIAVGATVMVKEKAVGKYGATLAGNLTVKEIGPSMILVADANEQHAWVPRGHLTKPPEVAA